MGRVMDSAQVMYFTMKYTNKAMHWSCFVVPNVASKVGVTPCGRKKGENRHKHANQVQRHCAGVTQQANTWKGHETYSSVHACKYVVCNRTAGSCEPSNSAFTPFLSEMRV